MRALIRILSLFLAFAAITLAGSSSALAAASPSTASLDANWCYQDGSTESCYDIDGTIRYLDTTAGSSVIVNEIIRTTVYESGAFAGESMSVQMLRGVFQADGTVVIQSLIHTRATDADGSCANRMVLRLIDYEAVVYQVTQTCGA